MASVPKRITLSEPGVAGPYELVERRPDGSLLLASQGEIDEWTGGLLLGLALWVGFRLVLWT